MAHGDDRWELVLPHGYRTLASQSGGIGGKQSRCTRARVTAPELYDLQNDRGETRDDAATHPGIGAQLQAFSEHAAPNSATR